MNKQIPWQLISDSFSRELTADETSTLTHWRARSNHELLYIELKALYEEIQTNSSQYTPNKEADWIKLSRQLNLSTFEREKKRSKYISLQTLYGYVAVAAVALIVVMASTFYVGRHSILGDVQELTYSSYGGKSRIVLPDGTLVFLHGVASVKYPTIFAGPSRNVSLEGEAFFIVAKDEKQPFVINALDKLDIKVLGTKFNVDAQPHTELITVSLNEGSVQLNSIHGQHTLKPGDKAIFNKRNGAFDIQNDADVAFESLWLSRRINFRQENLQQVCRKLEKWYNVSIHIDPEIASHYKYTFTLQDESLEEILRIMSRINPIHYTFPETKTVELKRSK